MELYARKMGCVLSAGFISLMFTYPIELARTRIYLELGKERTFKRTL